MVLKKEILAIVVAVILGWLLTTILLSIKIVHSEPHLDLFWSQSTSRVIQTIRNSTCVHKKRSSSTCILSQCETTTPGMFHYNNTSDRGKRMVLSGAPTAGSGCAISHHYKFIYIHVLKSGGMTIKAFLKRALCNQTATPCPMGRNVLEIVHCATAVSNHANYFVWSFVRNPFSRLYSGYSMADSMRTSKQRNTTLREFTFQEFALAKRIQRSSLSMTSTDHYVPQVAFLFDSSSCPVVDFIGHLEHFQEDLEFVLQKIQSPELQSYYDQHGEELHESSTAYGKRKQDKGESLSKVYATPKVMQAVANEFKQDFRLLRYDPTVIPYQ